MFNEGLDIKKISKEFFENVSPEFGGEKYLIPDPKLDFRQRDQRRLAFRNENYFYKRKSSLSGEQMISFLREDSGFKVYTKDEWWSDKWDAKDLGRDVDFGRSFFEQFGELQRDVPRLPLVNNNSENADYCNFADSNKNSYLITAANYNEDCYMSSYMIRNRNCGDCFWITDCERCYECIDCIGCYGVIYGQQLKNCSESMFLFDCRGVKNSIMCAGIENMENYFLNKPCSPKKIKEIKKKIEGSYQAFEKFKRKFEEMIKEGQPYEPRIIASENCTGNFIYNSNNIIQGRDVYFSEDCGYLNDGYYAKDSWDVFSFENVELCYESVSLMGYGYRFTMFCRESADLFYCDSCFGSQNLFGCVGLNKAQYCILNKQYSKERYEEIVPRIIEMMKARGEWGEFFPVQMSPWAYNETIAQLYYPMSEDEVKGRGWKWSNSVESGVESVDDGIDAKELSDSVFEVGNEMAGVVINSIDSGRSYKLLKQELKMYQSLGVPLPRKHPVERAKERIRRKRLVS